jgi:hypothetical protein
MKKIKVCGISFRTINLNLKAFQLIGLQPSAGYSSNLVIDKLDGLQDKYILMMIL